MQTRKRRLFGSFLAVGSIACLISCIGWAAGPVENIPFPDALEAATVAESKITDIRREALVLGNGDLNALLWDRDGALCLRVTKNDIWDARIDTSKDPDLLQMDIKNRTWKGGIGAVPSWRKHPYPQPVCAGEVVIQGPQSKRMSITEARLDLRHAVASVRTSGNVEFKVRIRNPW